MTTSAMSPYRDYLGVWEPDEIAQVLRDLDRLSHRTLQADLAQQRLCPRKPYSAPAIIRPIFEPPLPEGQRPSLVVVSRNLSRSGLGVLTPLLFKAIAVSGGTPVLRSKEIFCHGAPLEVGLHTSCGNVLWISGVVVRTRIVQHDFLDVGIQFKARITEPEAFGIE